MDSSKEGKDRRTSAKEVHNTRIKHAMWTVWKAGIQNNVETPMQATTILSFTVIHSVRTTRASFYFLKRVESS